MCSSDLPAIATSPVSVSISKLPLGAVTEPVACGNSSSSFAAGTFDGASAPQCGAGVAAQPIGQTSDTGAPAAPSGHEISSSPSHAAAHG